MNVTNVRIRNRTVQPDAICEVDHVDRGSVILAGNETGRVLLRGETVPARVSDDNLYAELIPSDSQVA